MTERILPDMSQFDVEDFNVPRWKVSKTGSFVNSITGEKAEIHAVILKIAYSRFLWPTVFNSKNRPLCFAPDGQTPTENVYAEKCIDCVMREWTMIDGKKVKPVCSKSYDFLIIDIDTGLPSVLSLARARTKTAKSLNSLFAMTAVKFELLFFTELESSSSGEFFQVKFLLKAINSNFAEHLQLMRDNEGTLLCSSIIVGDEEISEEADE